MTTLRIAFLLFLGALTTVSAQTAPATSDPPSSSSASRVAPPDPLAVNPLTGLTSASSSNYQPLTAKQRKKLYWKQNYFSLGAFVGPTLSALVLDQATGSPHAWGGGMEGFGHRLGSRLLSSTIQGNVQAALAIPLHEDVRYITSGHGGAGRRILHAVAFSFLTYNNHGHATVNFANLTGYYAATAASTAWIPTSESVGRYTLVHGSEQVGLSIPVNIVQEFWPDVSRRVFHHRP
jgi:hypothetical protein